MKVRVQVYADNFECDEWFDSIEDAEVYLAECDLNHTEDDCDEIDSSLDFSDMEPYIETRPKLSLSNQNTKWFKRQLESLLSQGYEVTYEGKTGVTLELKQ